MVTSAFVHPGPTNSFVPDLKASGQLVVDYARNIKDFKVNQYTQVVPVKKTRGLYLEINVDQAGRLINSDGRDFVWPDGQAATDGNGETELFRFREFTTERRLFAVPLGDLTVDQADWNIVAQHASIQSRRAMTLRTQLAVTVFTTSDNYDASHVINVDAGGTIGGNSGMWSESTTARQDIKRSLMYAAERILDDTLAAVNPNELILVINSDLAAQLAQCQEIVDFIKGSPDALAEIRGEKPGENVIYGLPSKLYGFPVVVELTRKRTQRKGVPRATSQVLPTATPFMCARPGSLEGVADAPNFSTVAGYFQEEMTVETLDDRPNRRKLARVVENYKYVMTAPASGVLFTNAATASV